MDHESEVSSQKKNIKMKGQEEVMSEEEEEDDDEETWDSDDDDDTIARIQRAHYAQAAAMSKRRRAPARPRAMSQKRKMEAFKNFHNFTKKLKKDTGVSIRSIVGKNILDLSDFSSEEDSKSDSDGLSEEEFVVNPAVVEELDGENESYIDPETGDIVERKKSVSKPLGSHNPTPELDHTPSKPTPQPKSESEADPSEATPDPEPEPEPEMEIDSEDKEEPKTLTISDLINEGDLDLTKTNVEIAEVEESDLCPEKTAEDLLGIKEEENSQDFDITNKLKDMGEISVKPVNKEGEGAEGQNGEENQAEGDDEKKSNPNALNVRRNIREVMDEKQLDASTLAAQRQESERLARVQEQQRIIREVQRQIAINRQNKVHQKTMQLLQGGSSLLKKGVSGNKLNLPNTVLVKLPSGDVKKTTLKQGQVDVTRLQKPTTSGPVVGQKVLKPEQKSDKKEVVEIVDSSSGEESSSSSSDSDDCIMLSDSEVPPSPEAEDDPNNSGLHVNDTYNVPDEQGRVQINVGHPENEEDIFLAPQIARIIKPHQIGGVRFLFDNIIESVERFSTSTGFGCILAHSMGLGKTLQIVCFCDIFLRHTSSKTVLCIMPINTLQNWVAEFNKWLPVDPTNNPLMAQGEVRPRNFPIYVLNDSHKTLLMRAKVVKDWTTTGGVLMIGYELYRLLSMKKDKKPRKKRKAELKAEAEKEKEDKKTDKPEMGNDDTQGSDITNQSKLSDEAKQEDGEGKADDDKKDDKKEDTVTDEDKKLLDEMYEALVKPGPDLVICDEGHRIKNSHSNISYALKQMRTKRRVVLTGYPLQNNLLEYWCMVDFVRPNYLGSKTEFCNMFERPIQNGQCIDSTPQDIRLMRYRAHVLHSLLVGFVQRRSHAVLQSTLPQKEEFVMLIRMTALQRKLYDRFMNEVVRCTSVPNPLKAFAICCKIWNHPDVLYNFLRKRSEANAAIEEELEFEELGGVTKASRLNKAGKPRMRPGPKPKAGKGAAKKPAATIPPNTSSTGPSKPNPGDPSGYGNGPYPPNGPPYGPPGPYRPNQPDGSYPPYPNYPNPGQGYYPPNQQQNYGNNYYQQPQQPPYSNNYPNQYPPNNGEQGYNQNYWNNGQPGNYYGNSEYYNNPQYPNNQPPQDFRRNPPPDYNNPQQYPPNYNQGPTDQPYQGNIAPPPYQNNQEGYANEPPQPYPQAPYQNQPGYPGYNSDETPGPSYPDQPAQTYPNQTYPPQYPPNTPYNNTTQQYNPQYNQPGNYPGYPNNAPPNQPPGQMPDQITPKTEPESDYPAIKTENNLMPSGPDAPYNPSYNYNQQNAPAFPNAPNPNANQYQGYPPHSETKPPLGSSDSPVTAWPMTGPLKTEINKLKNEEKTEVKSESDGEVKIEDLDTKTIVKDGTKSVKPEAQLTKDSKVEPEKKEDPKPKSKSETAKTDSGSEEEVIKKGKQKGKGKETKKPDSKRGRGKAKPKGRKDRKTSKEKNDDSDSDDSEKEEKLNRVEELALAKKAEEVTYDWATELLKDYIPNIIENSAKMELFFYILNESIKLGDRILLFSQSLFTLNLIEDFLVRNYIPGTHCLWEKNTSYYRLDGSTHALEREKLINEFNANPHVYLFLVSTRAGSLGINLVGANRVIVFDASWNPCHDTQAVCRVYRYGQKKPCFVYRFVMDCCLEKKIYDRQINKQGMADRVVDECNPDAVLSMKEITNLCFDNDEKETEAKDLSEHKDKYIDVIMQGIIMKLGKQLSKEPFQHESLLVDRKEKKLSSAEKRLAQRGYELEKKAAAAPKPTTAYRTVRTADGSIVQRPVGTVRPMQHGARWIPADVWRRQGMTAQEMTLPLDVVIPTNSAEKTNIVLKAGQRVMVLKSPKGIYMQLESGKIIAIKTSLKGLTSKPGDGKDAVGKKIMGARPSTAGIPGSLKNNSAITITSKSGPRPGLQRIITRPSMTGPNKLMRPLLPGQRSDIRRIGGGADLKSFTAARKVPLPPGRIIRPGLPGSVSITKITKDPRKSDNDSTKRMDVESDDETQVLDSDDDDKTQNYTKPETSRARDDAATIEPSSGESQSNGSPKTPSNPKAKEDGRPIVLTTDEKLPSEDAFDNKSNEGRNTPVQNNKPQEEPRMEHTNERIDHSNNYANDRTDQAAEKMDLTTDRTEHGSEKASKINPLKNYRHQRLQARATESSLSQLEKTAVSLHKEGAPAFRKNLDDITQSYSPAGEERPAAKSRKKKPPNKVDTKEAPSDRQPALMSHSVSSLLGPERRDESPLHNTPPVAPMGQGSGSVPMPHSHEHLGPSSSSSSMHGTPPISMSPGMSPGPEHHQGLMPPAPMPMAPSMSAAGQYPGTPPEGSYGQYPPGYGMGYGGYPNAPYYGGYGAPPYYPGYPAHAPPYPAQAPAPPSAAPAPDGYPSQPNPQW